MAAVRQYRPFVLEVREAADAAYAITAEFEGASWSASIPAALPLLTREEIDQALRWLDRGFIDREYAQDLGARLFETLLPGEIREGFREAYQRVAPQDGLRLVLTLPQSLAGLPWELMYDREGGHGFLARSATAPLVRHFAGLPLPNEPPQAGPLRVLIITASPGGHPPVSSEQEVAAIKASLERRTLGIRDTLRLLGQQLVRTRSARGILDRLRRRSLVELDLIDHATRSRVQAELRGARPYHAVHFIGHGQAGAGGAAILLEKEDGEPDPVPADDLAELIAEPEVNLAVLNACETAAAVNLFHSVAQATLERRVPAVMGMQVAVLDRAAVDFAREFYGAWAAGQPIEAALAYARRLVACETPGAAADWGIPILFMGPVEGLRLDLAPQPIPRPGPVKAVRWAIGAFLSLLGAVSLLLSIPAISHQVRTEVWPVRCWWPYPMPESSRFNVAVLPFPVVNESGSSVRSDDGQKLASYIYDSLEINFEESGGELGMGARGRDYEILSPDYTCPITGRTRGSRETKAGLLAQKLGADLIIYGVITDTQSARTEFDLEFWPDFPDYEKGVDITGPSALGSALSLPHPFDPSELGDEQPAGQRTQALCWISLGLSWFARDQPEKALSFYEKAEATTGWRPRDPGKAIVYVLLGNAASQVGTERDHQGFLVRASDYYSTAVGIDPNSARAKGGQALVLYLRALGDPADPDLTKTDWALIDQAEAGFTQALTLTAPASANIPAKVHFYLGQLNLVRAVGLGPEWFAGADAELQKVVNEYNDGKNSAIEDWAGHALARLGASAQLQGKDEEAIAHFEAAIPHVSPYYQAEYRARLGNVYAGAGRMDEACQAYREATEQAFNDGYPERAELYQRLVEKNECPE